MAEKTSPTCWICGHPVPVDYKSDGRGRPIHENCYEAAVTGQEEPTPPSPMGVV
jgi:hypothetical protein